MKWIFGDVCHEFCTLSSGIPWIACRTCIIFAYFRWLEVKARNWSLFFCTPSLVHNCRMFWACLTFASIRLKYAKNYTCSAGYTMDYPMSHWYFQVCIPRKFKWQVGHSMVYTTQKCCKTNLHHVIENAVVNTINAVHDMQDEEGVKPSSVQQLFCILIGCILCGI